MLPMSTEASAGSDPHEVLGYLLKHATAKLTASTDAALEPLGIDSKDFGACGSWPTASRRPSWPWRRR